MDKKEAQEVLESKKPTPRWWTGIATLVVVTVANAIWGLFYKVPIPVTEDQLAQWLPILLPVIATILTGITTYFFGAPDPRIEAAKAKQSE